jgi:parallel beta-helix repeat protein
MRRVFSLLVLLPLLVPACAHVLRETAGLPVVYVERDTLWSGTVPVDGLVHIRKGATLTLLPGTRVEFAARRFRPRDEHEGFVAPGISVVAVSLKKGTEEFPITFTSETRPSRPDSWDKILFSFSGGNRFRHCVFEGARYAFHAHFSEISVRKCLFRGNEEGVRLGTSRVTIEDSVFTGNEVRGINFRECRNEIRRNLVFGNGDGIFLHSKDSQSVIRENAVYGNRGYNLRLGDLHSEDIDVSGNWWGTPVEKEARETVYDGRNLEGLGTARIFPILAMPPVSGAEIRGMFVTHMTPVSGAEVRAYSSVAAGLWETGYVAKALTDGNGVFRLPVPPGRYFVVGRAESPAGTLFAFPGRNPVAVALGEETDIGLPSVLAPPRAAEGASPSPRPSVVARATHLGESARGVTVQAFRPGAPDFRGPGVASAVTNEGGMATLYLPPGDYFLAAKKRTTGAALGMVDEGGLFGVYPYSPVKLPAGTSVAVEIPLFEKRGILEEKEAPSPRETPRVGEVFQGTATIGGKPAEGYVVFFYRPPETIGRPLARSSTGGRDGSFTVSLPGPGTYMAYLRKAIPGLPAGTEEERAGPVSARAGNGKLLPSPLHFPAE